VNEVLWNEIMKQLFMLLTPHQHGRPVLLILDRHTTHLSVESINNALKQYVYPLYVPAYITYFLQPLDDAVTGAFKASIKKYKQEQILSHILHHETPVAVLQNITEKAAKMLCSQLLFKHHFATQVYGHLILQKFVLTQDLL
jgi:hypothetical protein